MTPLGHCTRAQCWEHRIFPGAMVHPAPAAWLRDSGLGQWTQCTGQPWMYTSPSTCSGGSTPGSPLALTQPLKFTGNSMTGNCHHFFFRKTKFVRLMQEQMVSAAVQSALHPLVHGHPWRRSAVQWEGGCLKYEVQASSGSLRLCDTLASLKICGEKKKV